jgi:FKBP-type peptidyl-prolyl cis-trans isomerase 2
VAAPDAYGEVKEGLSQRVPKKHFGKPAPGPGHAGRAATPTSARAR